MKRLLPVSEVFYSLQCEGVSTGVPAVFVRLGGCNLLCKGSGWTCDTIEVWRKSRATEFVNVISKNLIPYIKDGAHLIITGGEPLLHQEALTLYLRWFCAYYDIRPFIEVETNGTIAPDFELRKIVDQWNVSPKLSTVGEPLTKRVNEVALATLANKNITLGDTWFKFVISSEEDVLEFLDIYQPLVPKEKVILMPAGDTREKLDAIRLTVVEAAKAIGVRYCDRLHIVIWNQKTGV